MMTTLTTTVEQWWQLQRWHNSLQALNMGSYLHPGDVLWATLAKETWWCWGYLRQTLKIGWGTTAKDGLMVTTVTMVAQLWQLNNPCSLASYWIPILLRNCHFYQCEQKGSVVSVLTSWQKLCCTLAVNESLREQWCSRRVDCSRKTNLAIERWMHLLTIQLLLPIKCRSTLME